MRYRLILVSGREELETKKREILSAHYRREAKYLKEIAGAFGRLEQQRRRLKL